MAVGHIIYSHSQSIHDIVHSFTQSDDTDLSNNGGSQQPSTKLIINSTDFVSAVCWKVIIIITTLTHLTVSCLMFPLQDTTTLLAANSQGLTI